jgi:hypothetical protein
MKTRFGCRIWETKTGNLIPFPIMKDSHLRNALNYKHRKWTVLSPTLDTHEWRKTTLAIGRLHEEVWKRNYKIHPHKYSGVWVTYHKYEHLPTDQLCCHCGNANPAYVVIGDKSEWIPDPIYGELEYIRNTTLLCPICHTKNAYKLHGVGAIGLHYWNDKSIHPQLHMIKS